MQEKQYLNMILLQIHLTTQKLMMISHIIDLLQDDSYMDKIQQKNLTESDEEEIKN